MGNKIRINLRVNLRVSLKIKEEGKVPIKQNNKNRPLSLINPNQGKRVIIKIQRINNLTNNS